MFKIPYDSPPALGIWTALAVLLAAACLPIWTVWHIGEFCATGVGGPAWSAILQFLTNLPKFQNADSLLVYYNADLIKLMVVYLLAWGAGAAVWWKSKAKRSERPPSL